MTPAFALGPMSKYWLADARLLAEFAPGDHGRRDAEGFVRADVLVEAGRFGKIAPAGAVDFGETPQLALGGRIALPLFVDAHAHLDKGHIWARAPNPTGDFAGALEANGRDRETHWRASDVAARMEFSLRCAYAYGTRAIRTHIDSLGAQTAISWPVFAEARERWRGRIALQASPLFGVDHALDEAHMAAIEAAVERDGSRILGAVTTMTPRLEEGLSILFRLAERKGWELDFHVDESADPSARSLAAIARMAIARKFSRPIQVGHCCSLSLQDEREASETIALCERARLNVVSLPLCNLFLQDRRAGRTPRWRGVTALHELRAARVPVSIASDNTRDPFYAYGDLDMMEVWREGVRILHLDYPFAQWAPAVFTTPAKAIGAEAPLFQVGAAADFILTSARNFTELLSRPQGDRLVVRAGAGHAAPPPAYAELDRLEGLKP